MDHRASSVEIGYIRTQGIAYFVFALLFARAAAPNVGSTAPFMSVNQSGICFHLPHQWMPLSLAVISLAISLFFLVTLFFNRCMPLALRVAVWLSIPFYTAVLASFVVSWLTGLAFLIGLPHPWFDIFFWAGWIAFLGLAVHFILTPVRRKRPGTNAD